ncbi:MAG: 50S ribosomal protein L23, partial [Nitrospira sp. SB0678_bin_10]|nr:50S ribosomal protein L23 [Nitrospira sp. SB0678_bin_10]
ANRIAFVVQNDVNRIEVRQAVESVLKVKVKSVNIMNVLGKKKRQGRYLGKRADWKKAIITLHEGEKVELYESA